MRHIIWTCIYYILYLTGRSNSMPADMIIINLRISFVSISQIWMICQAGNMLPEKSHKSLKAPVSNIRQTNYKNVQLPHLLKHICHKFLMLCCGCFDRLFFFFLIYWIKMKRFTCFIKKTVSNTVLANRNSMQGSINLSLNQLIISRDRHWSHWLGSESETT